MCRGKLKALRQDLEGFFKERGEGVSDVYGSYPNVERTICVRDSTVIEKVLPELKDDM